MPQRHSPVVLFVVDQTKKIHRQTADWPETAEGRLKYQLRLELLLSAVTAKTKTCTQRRTDTGQVQTQRNLGSIVKQTGRSSGCKAKITVHHKPTATSISRLMLVFYICTRWMNI